MTLEYKYVVGQAAGAKPQADDWRPGDNLKLVVPAEVRLSDSVLEIFWSGDRLKNNDWRPGGDPEGGGACRGAHEHE